MHFCKESSFIKVNEIAKWSGRKNSNGKERDLGNFKEHLADGLRIQIPPLKKTK